MGERGPVGKRSDQRLGHHAKDDADDIDKLPGAEVVEVPAADPDWHPIALAWFESLAKSGQAVFYEPSDWATAVLVAESMSRELKPQGLVYQGMVVSYHSMTIKAASLSTWMSAMAVLMVNEGDRRRMRLELQRPKSGGEEGDDAHVSWLDDARRRATGAG